MEVSVLAGVMFKLFMLMLLGFVLNKKGILDENTNRGFSALIVNVTMPLLIISSVLSASAENRLEAAVLLAAGMVMYPMLMLFGRLMAWLLRFPKDERRIYECMCVFSNNAFMGYPVLQSVLGDEAVFYCCMVHFAFNIYVYTYGVDIFAPKEGRKHTELKKMINPGFVLGLTALVLFVLGIRNSGIIYDTVYMAGNLTSGLSMITLGSVLAMYPIRSSLTNVRFYIFSFIRLIAVPLVSFGVCRLLGVNDYYTKIVTITNAMPVANLVLMLATQYRSEGCGIITGNILVSTLLSNITIPILCVLLF